MMVEDTSKKKWQERESKSVSDQTVLFVLTIIIQSECSAYCTLLIFRRMDIRRVGVKHYETEK
jgi:hypothetical protein